MLPAEGIRAVLSSIIRFSVSSEASVSKSMAVLSLASQSEKATNALKDMLHMLHE